jgi:hypothetical protein
MTKGRVFDLIFILLSFGLYIFILNIDQNINSCNIVCKHIWLPLILAYYIGLFVSIFSMKRSH